MTATIIPFQRPHPQLILWGAPGSDMERLIAEADLMATRAPELLTMIDADLDAHGLTKKRERQRDRDWQQAQNATLPGFGASGQSAVVGDAEAREGLAAGRPRLPARLVLLFLLMRGYLGGFKCRKAYSQMLDSMALRSYLARFGKVLPGQSTLVDNVNAVRNATRERILDAQISFAKEEGLDDFAKLAADSTDVRANSKWPSESGVIAALLRRVLTTLRGLADFGVKVDVCDDVDDLVARVENEHKRIQLESGKKGSARKRRKRYGRIFKLAAKLGADFTTALGRADALARPLSLMPSMRMRLSGELEGIEVDLRNIAVAAENARERVNCGRKVPAPQKVLSVSDDDAAMIVKGGREPNFGYKPQLARSGKGFVTAIVTPQGNAADSGQIEAIADAAIARTGVVPELMSFDDGYVNSAARAKYEAMGVGTVSFSGSKGKRATDRKVYDSDANRAARAWRSSIESSIFTLKHNHDFENVMRRGLDDVRAELLEKVLAHNLFRTIELRIAASARKAA